MNTKDYSHKARYTLQRTLQMLQDHDLLELLPEFLEENGTHQTYPAETVLSFLGY